MLGFAYRLKSTGKSSSHYGPCEVCQKHCSEVFLQTESRPCLKLNSWFMGWTYHRARAQVFGHKECLIALQETVDVSLPSADKDRFAQPSRDALSGYISLPIYGAATGTEIAN